MAKPSTISLATTHRVRGQCLCLHTQRAARVLARRFDEALRAFNLTNGQFSLLMSLNRAPPPSIGESAAFLAMDRTTLTAAMKPLERRSLIKVKVDPHDRRGRLLLLTAAGRALLASAVPAWRRTHAAIEGALLAAKADPDGLRRNLRALS